MKFYVEVVRRQNDEVVKTIGPIDGERTAERTEDGVNINLNHEDYFTRIRKDPK